MSVSLSQHLVLVLALLVGGGAAAQVGPADPEPAFDDGLVLGTVYCDDDGDGAHGPSEVGLGGVRVVADHGWEVVSDRRGRWHLRRLAPGVHLLKVDEGSLPPGSTLPDGPRHIVRVDGGLPAPVEVGVRCRLEVLRPTGVEAPEGLEREAAPAVLPLVTVSGHIDPLRVTIEGRTLPALDVHLELEAPAAGPDRGLNLQWRPGPLEEPLVFSLGGRTTASAPASWRLVIHRVTATEERLVRELFGQGAPPAELSWDGTGPDGSSSLLVPGALYRVRLHIADGAGRRLTSPLIAFGVSYGDAAKAIETKVLRGRLFDAAGRPTGMLRRALQGLRKALRPHLGARVLIEVHTDDAALPDVALARTRKSAFLAAKLAASALRIGAARVMALGYGGARPLRPNVSDKDRRFNQRVEVTILPRERPEALLPIPSRQLRAGASIDGLDAPLSDDGVTFVRSVARPSAGLLPLEVVDRRGARLEAVVDLAELPPLGEAQGAPEDPLRRFGGKPLRDALGDPLIGSRTPGQTVTAGDLEVRLPPAGEVADARRIFVSGRTSPSNTLEINARPVRIDEDGSFGEIVPLEVGTNRVEVVTTDPTGHRARVVRSVEVDDVEFFLLALADGAMGELDAHLRDRGPTTAVEVGPVFLQGRGAVYLQGRVSGTVLAEHLFFTAHLDSAKREPFHAFYEQVIDPAREYAVFADAAEEEQTARARGPLYVLVEADESRLLVGDERVGIEGIELVRYDRALYGAQLDFRRAFAPGWDTRVKAFVSDDIRRLRRGHDELRATGGSLYYLSGRDVLEGSERLTVVVREQDTRLELSRTELVRDRDYRIEYPDGRIFLRSPLSASADSATTLGPFQARTGRRMLVGHEVWLVVDYETRDRSDAGEIAGGGYASQRLFDRVEVGGGYVQEARGGAGGDYRLFGGHVAVELAERSRVFAEVAGSRGVDGASRLSDDGGLSYLSGAEPVGGAEGLGWKLGLDSHVGELVGLDEGLDLQVRGWWHVEEAGFRAVGHLQDQGTERAGGEAVYRPSEDDELRLRFDWTTALLPDARFSTGYRAVKRHRTSARYQRRIGPVTLHADGAWGQHRDDESGKVYDTGGVGLGARWRLLPQLEVHLAQESILAGDDALLGPSLWARQITRWGADWQILDDLALSVGHAVRWDGDNAMRVGLRTRIDDRTSAYLEERLEPDDDGSGVDHAAVVGVETRLDGGGRAWSEYRVDGGIASRTSQAIVGIGRRFELAPGVAVHGAYERAQTFGGGEGSRSRDVLSAGVEVVAVEWLKFGGRYELRWDREAERERVQVLLLNGVTARLGEDVTLTGTLDYTLTQDLSTRAVEREALQASVAGLWRPHPLDWLTLMARYGRVSRRRLLPAAGLAGLGGLSDVAKRDERATVDLASLGAIFELPLRLRLTEQATLRHRTTREPEAGEVTTLELLWASRLGFHLVAGLDIAGEYRLLVDLQTDALHHGALAEVGYTLFDYVRLAVGYDFTEIPRELDVDATPGRGGVYARVTGTY